MEPVPIGDRHQMELELVVTDAVAQRDSKHVVIDLVGGTERVAVDGFEPRGERPASRVASVFVGQRNLRQLVVVAVVARLCGEQRILAKPKLPGFLKKGGELVAGCVLRGGSRPYAHRHASENKCVQTESKMRPHGCDSVVKRSAGTVRQVSFEPHPSTNAGRFQQHSWPTV